MPRKKFDPKAYKRDLNRLGKREAEVKQKRNQILEQRIRGINYAISILHYASAELEKRRGIDFDFEKLVPPMVIT